MTKAERVRQDAFSGGVISALIVIRAHRESDYYDDIVATTGARELVNFARRNNDSELKHLRRSIKRLTKRGAL